jgi:hypothetical protein
MFPGQKASIVQEVRNALFWEPLEPAQVVEQLPLFSISEFFLLSFHCSPLHILQLRMIAIEVVFFLDLLHTTRKARMLHLRGDPRRSDLADGERSCCP